MKSENQGKRFPHGVALSFLSIHRGGGPQVVVVGMLLCCFFMSSGQILAQENQDTSNSVDFYDISDKISRYVMHEDDEFYLELYINHGESGTDGQNNDKSMNGIDDDGDGTVDNYRMWYFHIIGQCAGFVFDHRGVFDTTVVSNMDDDKDGKKCLVELDEQFYAKVHQGTEEAQ